MNNYKKKIVSFEHMERTGTVEVHPINLRKFQNISFTCFKDSKTGLWYGVPMDEDEKGNVIFKRITITGIRHYSLENEEDAREYHILKHHQSMEGSPFARNPQLRIFDRTREAGLKLKKLQESRSALEIALKMEGVALMDFARILGINTEQNAPIVVKQLVAERAADKPEAFMMMYSNSDRNVQQIFKRAEAAGLIKYRIDTGWVYRDSFPLGLTESSAIVRLMEERALLSNLDIESSNILAEKNEIYAQTPRKVNIVVDKIPEPQKQIVNNPDENLLQGFGEGLNDGDSWDNNENLNTVLDEVNNTTQKKKSPVEKAAETRARNKVQKELEKKAK